jgi:NADP-dependent 3-hydroxy acid dehydrogenase YdfG
MTKRLKDRVVCVTGAGRGLGRAIAKAFAAEGASLVLGARSTGEIDELASELPDAIAVQTDVRLVADVDRLVEAAVAEFGRLDVMVNNAGVAVYGPLENMGADEVHVMVDTNLKGTIFGSQAALRVMAPQRGGLIVNISSIAGRLHLPNEAVYGATKWAVNGFSGVLRLEAQKHGIRVSCVCPGGIDTPFWKSQEFLPFPENIDPERDFLRPEHVAQAVLNLALGPDNVVVPELVVLPMLP